MELKDEIIEENETLSSEEENKLFYQLLRGKTATETIKTSRGEFVVKYPKQKDLLLIDKKVALLRSGLPASSFDENANFNLNKVAFLDVVVISGDSWFNILKSNKNFTWGDMPDEDFVNEIYLKAFQFRLKVQEQLNKDKKQENNRLSESEEFQSSMDDNVFQGVASQN